MKSFPSFREVANKYREKNPNASYLRLLTLYFYMRVSYIFRKKRFERFLAYIKQVKKPLKVLDLGGTLWYWKNVGMVNAPGVSITLLNIFKQENHYKNIKTIVGDARNLSRFKNKQFDVVYSNSLIEHIGDYDTQYKLSKEIRRIGKKYYVQTPNKYFIVEPHLLIPFFFLIPERLKPFIAKTFRLNWWLKRKTEKELDNWIETIRLLDRKEMSLFFEDGTIYEEKFLFFTKSFIAYK